MALEITYQIVLAPWWSLQPDFQYIWNPGGNVPDDTGTRPIKDATVLGVRTTISF